MVQRIALAALFAFSLTACATTPAEGEDGAKDKETDGVHCTTERDIGSRKPVKVCR